MVRYAKHLTEAIAIYHYLGGMAYAKSSNQLYTSTSTVDCTDPSIVTKDTCIFNANCEWNASTDGRRPFCIRRRDLLQESTSSPSSKPTGMAKVAKTRIIRTRRPTPAPSIVLPPSVAPARLAFDTNAPTLGLVTSTQAPTLPPSKSPSSHPSMHPTHEPTGEPTKIPTGLPTNPPTFFSTVSPSMHPSMPPTQAPTGEPSKHPTEIPTNLQTSLPTEPPSRRPTAPPTRKPTGQPTNNPTSLPTESRIAISFVFMGDIPYQESDRYCLNKQLRGLDPSSMEFPYNFIVHIGDIKSGQVACQSSSYSDVAQIFSHASNTIYYDPRDVFFIVGDNEWTDCSSRTQGFSWWMNNFGNGRKTNGGNTGPNPYGFGTFSDSKMRATLEYDWQDNDGSSSYYPTSATNFAFFYNKVLFVGINQVGGGTVGDEATRVRNNFLWTKNNMAKYASQGMRTLVVFAHAPMTGARQAYFGDPFKQLLLDEYPLLLVLYSHGDGHTYSFQRDYYNSNLYDLQCDSGSAADPLLITVLREPNNDKDSLKIDRRAGKYSGGCKPGSSDKEKTWG
ncbi:hypothetical protein HJC23_008579 [Cyclotella cryptica]|uniref:Calcineurin-like phosphoesterase domain-containing protein n=1 Tax=Cyclotella cryptica TaxID=29204 RepID=A0ABD3Q8N7_9STRA|eukprot:CCRYP_007923-RA/>CCRYP_007923-RA protein AED:0.31 eAED:0.31 QI:255/1/1/1/1/1/4/101/560